MRDNSQSQEECQKGLLKPNEWEQNQNEQIQPGYGQMRKDHQLKAAQIPNKLGANLRKGYFQPTMDLNAAAQPRCHLKSANQKCK